MPAVEDPGQIVVRGVVHKGFDRVRGLFPRFHAEAQLGGRFDQPGVMPVLETLGQMLHLKRGQERQAVPDLEPQLVTAGLALLVGRHQPFGIEHIQHPNTPEVAV